MSSLIGASLVTPNKLFFGIFGDLSFFYDMNVLGNRHVGNNVRISRVVISHNGIRIAVDANNENQGGMGGGRRRRDEKQASMVDVQGETTVDDLVNALNAVGATPKDLIAIFEAINAAGALHGDLKIM